MSMVNGATGRFVSQPNSIGYKPGNYGRNAADNQLEQEKRNVQNFAEQVKRSSMGDLMGFMPPTGLEKVMQVMLVPFQFSDAKPGSESYYQDAFGAAERKVALMDRDNSNSVSYKEFWKSEEAKLEPLMNAIRKKVGFLAGPAIKKGMEMFDQDAKKAFATQDRNRDGVLEPVEFAASLIFTDAPAQFMQAADPAFNVNNAPTPQWDGQVTYDEFRYSIDRLTMDGNKNAGAALDTLTQQQSLHQRYQSFERVQK